MQSTYIHFAKLTEKAVVPSKRLEDSGYDIYSCFEDEDLILEPGDIKIVPTGICSAFSNDLVLFVKERSSTGAIGLAVRMGVIDSGYRGEIKIALNNTSKCTIVISKRITSINKHGSLIEYPYFKAIAQMVFCKIPAEQATEISYKELLSISSLRGDTYLGASGK